MKMQMVRVIDEFACAVIRVAATLFVDALKHFLLQCRLVPDAGDQFEWAIPAVPTRRAEAQFGISSIWIRRDVQIGGRKRAQVRQQFLCDDGTSRQNATDSDPTCCE